jgi:integrase
MSDIKVTVIDFKRKFLYMRYRCPTSGKIITQSTGTANRKLAERKAAVWEDELRSGKYKPQSKITWKEFRTRYEDEVLASFAINTEKKVCGVFNAVEELVGVDRLVKLDAEQLSKFQKRLRDERKIAEITIKGMLSHLRAALRWAVKIKILGTMPEIELPKRGKNSKLMKGRPFSTEELERMLSKTREVIDGEKATEDSDATGQWKWFLKALWFSGLRLSEALDLSWDESGHIEVDLAGEFPMFAIPAAKQKSGTDELLPIAPEFAQMLQEVPQNDRHGPVFKLGRKGTTRSPGMVFASKVISDIGEKAGVVVNRKPLKYASAHDFRRSFGERWSTRVFPIDLMAMMRHTDISTTMRFYANRNGQKTAGAIYKAFYEATEQNSHTQSNTEQVADATEPQDSALNTEFGDLDSDQD